MITENLSTLKIHKLTKEQYDKEFEAGRIDENALYLTPDEEMDLSGYATVEQLNTKADTEHTHTTSDITDFQESLNTAINEAITQAKESGELKGEPGAKGDKGDKGEKGDPGKDGVGIEGITTAPSGDGAYTIIFIHTSDGNTYEAYIPKGEDGADGTDGVGIANIGSLYMPVDEYSGFTEVTITLTNGASESFTISSGKTPQKGVDYWTDADKAEIKSYVDEAILGGAW